VLLSGLLTDALGWWSIFAVSVPVALLALAATPRLVPGDSPGRDGGLDLAGAVTVTLGLVGIVYGLSGGGPVALGAGAASLVGFVVIERRVADPLIPPSLLRTAQVGIGNLVMLLLGMVGVGTFFFLPLYQQRVLGYSPLEAGLTQLPLALALILAPLVAGRLRNALVLGLLMLATGLACTTPIPSRSPCHPRNPGRTPRPR
jgi:hypothetical protein